MMRTAPPPPAGLYVHVPFCRAKCRYCDFYSSSSVSRVAEWLRALGEEVALYRDRFSFFDTLYLGGGTPTLLSEQDLDRLMECLLGNFRFCPDAEITLEANPNDVTHERLRVWRELGFNRISLGVQSMEDKDLEFLGRRHTARQATLAMECIRAAGFPGFGIDLLYGLPGQTERGWKRTLREALVFAPQHVSCYQLTVSRGTPLWEMQEAGILEPPGEERERSLFLAASDVLEQQGFFQYEVSNYAGWRNTGLREPSKENLHVCRHNLKYWERAPYLGLGPSAHSFQGNTRWWNLRSVEDYCEALGRGRRPVQGSERLSEEQASLERLSLQLRTRAGTGVEASCADEEADRVLPALLAAGLLEMRGGRTFPTREGLLVADRLPLLFL